MAASARYANRVAFRHIVGSVVREFKYKDLATLSYRDVQALWARGLRAGDMLAIWADNSPDWVLACIAAWRLGLILIPLDSRSKATEVLPVIEKTKPKLVLCGRKQYVRIQDKLPHEQLVMLDELATPTHLSAKEKPKLVCLKEDDTAVIIFTSGTSGASKGVVLSHKNILFNTLTAAKAFKVNVDDRFLSILPLSHMLEFTGGLLGPLNNGSTIVYSQLKGASHLKELLKVEKISVLLGTPLVFQAIVNSIEAEIEKLPRSAQVAIAAARQVVASNPKLGPILFKKIHNELGGKIKFWLAGGAPTPPETITKLRSFGITLLTGYGLTEAAPIVSANRKEDNKADTVGPPIDGVEVKIDNPQETSAGIKTGEILVRGPNVMSHYYQNPEETEKVLRNGWLHTGDCGYLDRDGHIKITGRMKSMIVTAGGYNLFPEEMEEALSKSQYIKEVCVFGATAAAGEEAFAVIVPSESLQARPDRDGIIQQEVTNCLSVLADYKRLGGYQIWDQDLPRTGIGKVRRGEVARLFELTRSKQAQEKTPVEGINWDEDGQRVCRIIGDVMDPDTLRGLSPSGQRLFSPQANLNADLGLDSFARLELTCRLEEEFGLALEADGLQEAVTVEDIVIMIKSARRLCKTSLEPISEDSQPIAVEDAVCVETKPWPREWIAQKEFPLRETALFVAGRRALGIGLKAALKVYNHFSSEGADRLLIEPPYIVAPNHTSHFDTAAIMGAFPSSLLKRVHPVAAAENFFANKAQALFSSYVLNAVPFERYGNFEQGMRECEELLRNDQILIVYPEGTRTRTGKLGTFKPGAAKLSILTQCPIIPAYIEGADAVMPIGKSTFQPATVKVTFGLPIYPQPGEADMKACQELTARVKAAIEELARTNQIAQEEKQAVNHQ